MAVQAWIDLQLARFVELVSLGGGPAFDFSRDGDGEYTFGNFGAKSMRRALRALREVPAERDDVRLLPLAAYAGEAARHRFGGGRWLVDSHSPRLVLFEGQPVGPFAIWPVEVSRSCLEGPQDLDGWLADIAMLAEDARLSGMTLQDLMGGPSAAVLDEIEAGDEEAALRAMEDGLIEPDDVG